MNPYVGPLMLFGMLVYGFTMLFATVRKERGLPVAVRMVGSITVLLIGAIILGVLGWNTSF